MARSVTVYSKRGKIWLVVCSCVEGQGCLKGMWLAMWHFQAILGKGVTCRMILSQVKDVPWNVVEI